MTQPGRPRHVPPRLATRLLAATLPRAEREALLGDLEETYARRRQRDGALRAAVWYWSQVLAAPARVAYEERIDRRTPPTRSARSGSIGGAVQALAND
ncbi:MAG: permease prefix domain 2-containing transporter, partial [Thermoanaerobaculia bacterium]|nr:permease prefix domain 2-containing transporter [Thermoanaerobaculia bacterium]